MIANEMIHVVGCGALGREVAWPLLAARPYVAKAGKFRRRFWSDVTPFEAGLAEAAHFFPAVA